MKKIIVMCLTILLLVSGCGEATKEDVIKEFNDKVTDTTSYKIIGTMEIMNGDDKFNYNLEANYLEANYYKVVLINETNNHEQVILRNSSGVYVISPSLNKSFKFDSVWPDNSSQGYLLGSLLKDLNSDEKSEITENEDGYIIKTVVNYPNNSSLQYQKIYFDKDYIPYQVEVYDSNDNISIKVNFEKVDLKANLKESDFDIEQYIDTSDCDTKCESSEDETTCKQECEVEKEEVESGSLEDIIYPLYVPANTNLTSSEKIETETTDRNILTFTGEKNFVVVEEVSKISEEFEIIPINGNPEVVNDTVAALSNNSIYFTRNNIDYYIVSNDLTNEEMLSIASSMGVTSEVMVTK